MRVVGLLHKVGEGVESLFLKIERATRESEIVVAPEYALALDLGRPDKPGECAFILDRLRELSCGHNGLIFPGTMPFTNHERMRLICPILSNGELIQIIQKERSVGESALARKFGLEYERGNCNKNNVLYNGRNIAVELCADHGHQRIPSDTFLELILSYDRNAGFYLGIGNVRPERDVIVCDSFKPSVEAFHVGGEDNLRVLDPVKEYNHMRIYDIR